jgi:hypothetical protein
MHESASAQIELLTDELRQLVGRGTNPMRLVTLPTLRSLAVGELAVDRSGYSGNRFTFPQRRSRQQADPVLIWRGHQRPESRTPPARISGNSTSSGYI